MPVSYRSVVDRYGSLGSFKPRCLNVFIVKDDPDGILLFLKYIDIFIKDVLTGRRELPRTLSFKLKLEEHIILKYISLYKLCNLFSI